MWGTRLRQGVLITIFLVVLMPSSSTLASEEQINAVGSYTMGQDDTLQKAQETALSEALRSAAEQVGVYVKSYTKVDDFAVTKDQVEVSAEHTMKVVSKRFERSVTPSGDIHITAYIDVTYDPDAILADLQRLMQTSQEVEPQGQPMTLHLSFGDRDGLYEGDLNAEGLPDGQGRFSWENGSGAPITYEGAFRNGHFHGLGKKAWSHGYYEEGNFVNDVLNGYGKRSDTRDPTLNYEGNFLHGYPMLDPVRKGETVEFDGWEYPLYSNARTTNSLFHHVPDGKYVIVTLEARNLMEITRQIAVNTYFILFDRTNGNIYPFDLNVMRTVAEKMTPRGGKALWALSDTSPGSSTLLKMFIFDVPKAARIDDLLFIPAKGLGKVAPIQLQER